VTDNRDDIDLSILLEWDHKHNKEKIQAYEFESPGQLMEDFWKDVNEIIGK